MKVKTLTESEVVKRLTDKIAKQEQTIDNIKTNYNELLNRVFVVMDGFSHSGRIVCKTENLFNEIEKLRKLPAITENKNE